MSTPASKPRPVRIAGAILAAISIIAGGITGVAGLQENPLVAMYAGIAMLVAGALTATLIPVLEGKVVPVLDVATYLDADRQLVSGPAKAQEWKSYGFEIAPDDGPAAKVTYGNDWDPEAGARVGEHRNNGAPI